MSVFERIIYEKLADLYSMTRWYVRTAVVAGHLATNDRTIRLILARLEAKGYIERRGERGGWMPVEKRAPRGRSGLPVMPMAVVAGAGAAHQPAYMN